MYNETSQVIEENVNKKPTPLAGSFLYFIVLALMIASSLLTSRIKMDGDRYYIFMFLLQLVTVGLPPIVYLVWRKKDIKFSLRLKKASLAEVLLAVGMAFFGYGVIIFINILWLSFLSRFGTPRTTTLPDIDNARQYLMALIVIAAVPAVVEEFLFRGVIQRGYEKLGRIIHIILTGTLFALLHVSVVSVPAIIFIGILLCYIAYRSDSIWPGMAFHFANNAIAVTMTYISSVISKLFPAELDTMPANYTDIPPEMMKMAIAMWSVVGFIALLFFGACLAGFYMVTRDKKRTLPVETDINKKGKFKQLLPAVLAVVVIIILLVFEIIEMVNPTSVL